MKHFKLISLISFLLLMVAACDSGSEPGVEERKEAIGGEQITDEFIVIYEKNLKKLENKMTHLKAQIDQTTGETKQALQKQWEELQSRKKEFKATLEEFKDNTGTNAEEMKTEIENQWEILKDDLAEMKNEFNVE